ncbi:hypothetical protein [Mycolicibacterium pyrenivorans]|uniref:hypothetical protein n=1 Tax=Mycolicibacterium pyrenivorans TaxID=187102 RepID=UPI0021F3366B|nr:hypothetical protein [Mycolicibacterium pyrenivorans]
MNPERMPAQGIAISTAYFPLSWGFVFFKPKVLLNGYEMPVVGWGRGVYPTWPGRYHVQVFVPYLIPSRVGVADHTVLVNPGQLVELEYKMPLWTFSRGALGPPPQRYSGVAVIVGAALAALVITSALTIVLLYA